MTTAPIISLCGVCLFPKLSVYEMQPGTVLPRAAFEGCGFCGDLRSPANDNISPRSDTQQ